MASGRCAPINGALCVRARFIGRGGRQEEEGEGSPCGSIALPWPSALSLPCPPPTARDRLPARHLNNSEMERPIALLINLG